MSKPNMRTSLAVAIAALAGTALAGAMPASGADDANEPARPRKVAIVLFDGVELLDFAGPAEVFIVAGEGRLFQVFTVAETSRAINTMGGISVQPEFDLKTAPQPDILVVPGGNTGALTQPARDWLREASSRCEVVMSVCMGAFVLADLGLLDGIDATTHRWGQDRLEQRVPTCRVQRDKRFVDAGKVVTTAGVTAGIDGALHLVERFYGEAAARWTADEWMEYKRPQAQP